MAVDAGIYAQQQQQTSPLKNISDAMVVQGQQQAQQLNALKIQQEQQAMAAQKQIDDAYAGAVEVGPDGTPVLNPAKLFSHLPGHQVPVAMKTFQEAAEALSKFQKQKAETAIAQKDAAGVLVSGVESLGYDPKVFTTAVGAAQKAGVITPEQANDYLIRGGNDPTQIKAVVESLKAGSKTSAETSNQTADAQLRTAQTGGAQAESEIKAKVNAGTDTEGINAEQAAQLNAAKAKELREAQQGAARLAIEQQNANRERAAADKPEIFFDKDGNPRALTFKGGKAQEVALPAGIAGKGNAPGQRPLPATTADNLALVNSSEVQGVKVLRELKSSGLDTSNNPADPRWQKFMVTTLKVAPADFNKADIQQRTAYVTAALTRGLMGGRPSQYVAQMIQQHMPQGEMTGEQLFHVMSNVMEESSGRRAELEGIQQRAPGSLGPKSGESYAQFLKSLSDTGDTTAPPPKTNPFRK